MLQQQWFIESPIKTQSLWGNKTHSVGVHWAFREAPEKWDPMSSQTLLVLSVAKGCGISPAWLHSGTRDVFLPAILLSGKGQPFSLQGQSRKRVGFPDMWYSFAWNFWHHLLEPGAAASSQALGFGVGLNGKGEMHRPLPGILQHSLHVEWGVQGVHSQGLTDPASLWLAFIALGKQPRCVGVPANGSVVLVTGCTWALPEFSMLFMAQGLHCAWPRFCQHRCWGWGWIP